MVVSLLCYCLCPRCSKDSYLYPTVERNLKQTFLSRNTLLEPYIYYIYYICVFGFRMISRSRRLRQITQTRGFDNSRYHAQPQSSNNCLILLNRTFDNANLTIYNCYQTSKKSSVLALINLKIVRFFHKLFAEDNYQRHFTAFDWFGIQ